MDSNDPPMYGTVSFHNRDIRFLKPHWDYETIDKFLNHYVPVFEVGMREAKKQILKQCMADWESRLGSDGQ